MVQQHMQMVPTIGGNGGGDGFRFRHKEAYNHFYMGMSVARNLFVY